MPQQKRSFLPYSRGINPENLRLGGLYLNPLDPDDGLESKRFEYREDLDQTKYEEHIKTWIQKEQKDERGCSLDFQLTRDTSLALIFSDLVKAEAGANSTVGATLEGLSGRRLKINKPEKFLRDEVIKQSGVQEWIRTQASISFKGRFGTHKFKAPDIWMVTGIQFITGGTVQVGSSRSVNGTIGASGDVGVAFGAPPGLAKVGAEVSHSHSSEANQDYGYDDERVWAAQFMPVKIEYGTEVDKTLKTIENKPAPATISSFHLEDIADLKSRGIRATQKQRADATGQAFVKPPKLVGRVVVDSVDDKDYGDDASEDSDDIQLNDQPYVDALKGTDWDMYDECSKYLRNAETKETPVNPEPIRAG